MRRIGGKRVALLGAILALALTGTALAAFQQLPLGVQVNNDPGAGIDPAQSVGSDDPANADVVGGALIAGNPAVPWSVFRQETTGADQIFSRSFGGPPPPHWTTRGHGTVGGRSSASPTFSGSLNFDQGQDGEAPSIDFAGANRAVPWATWYESTTGTGFGGADNVFASRFDLGQDKWLFAGQGRGTGGIGTTQVPSLNIHTDQDAENPSVAGGSAVDATKPGPWVTWQETDAVPSHATHKQIFVEKPIGPGTTTCPVGTKPAGGAPVGGFCWQQVGLDRVGADPSLNVDPTRGDPTAGEGGIEPDIAFTGKTATGVQDGVPWVVWYENGGTDLGLRTNELVFAAKGVPDVGADGGFHWQVVGNAGTGVLDNSGATHGFGACAESQAAEGACSLNKDPAADAEDPRIAAGTMNPANPTVPWIAWDEKVGATDQIFVSRLVGGTHFELANNGQPISLSTNPSTRPDITFSGNTPYVSWREDTGGGVDKAFYGHFVNPANPTFVLDNGPTDITPTAQADVREPISSSCIATPFNGDGAACQGDAVGTPFFLFTNGTSPRTLLADAYQTDAPTTGAASAVGSSAAIVSGAVNPEGAPVKVQFQFGTTIAYGLTTAAQKLGPANSAVPFAAALTGLPASTVIHYRAVAITDFGTFVGTDQTLKTAAPVDKTPPHLKLKILKTTIKSLLKTKKLKVKVTTNEASSVKLTASTRIKVHRHNRTITLGKLTVKFSKAGSKTARIKLSKSGLKAIRHLRKVKIKVTGKATDLSSNHSTKSTSRTIKRR